MKSIALSFAGAGLVLLLTVGAAAAATPAPTPAATATAATAGTIAAILGLTDAQVITLRQGGLSLAQIAEQQKVDPQRLVDALAAQWSVRIDARLAAGAITADQATTLKGNVAVQAKAMIYQVTLGGMRGAAVGAGPNGAMRGTGAGAGAGAGANGMAGNGAGRGGMMRGAGAGSNGCLTTTTAPSS